LQSKSKSKSNPKFSRSTILSLIVGKRKGTNQIKSNQIKSNQNERRDDKTTTITITIIYPEAVPIESF
jgi:hypothetical protein